MTRSADLGHALTILLGLALLSEDDFSEIVEKLGVA